MRGAPTSSPTSPLHLPYISPRYDELKQREEEERRAARAQSGQAAVAGLWNSMSGKNPTGRRLAQVPRHPVP